jgi:Ca2+/Na+ antiporter
MKNNPNKLWIAVIALGWAFDFLFWKKAPGVNFAIFWTLCVTVAFYLLLSDGLRPHRNSLLLIPLFGFFAAVTFIRAEPMTTFLAYTFTLLTMTLLAVTYLGGRWIQYNIADYVVKPVLLLASIVGRPLTFGIEAARVRSEAQVKPAKYNLWPILRGLLIAIPIVAIFASLLSSADAVFAQRLEDFIELFKLEDLPEYIFRTVYILVIGYALAGIILHASTESKDAKLATEDKPLVPAFFGFVESAIVLGSVVALFTAFVVIQFQYFFGGHTNINVEGFTYSEYARRGFGELVAVAFFALFMLLGLSAITKRETETQRKVYSGLGVALVALLLVMLVSAYQRLGLYEAAYGFSRLRTYTHVFLYWIGLLLVVTILLEILRKERFFTFALLLASFGFAISLPIVNVDEFIVNQNIQRELDGVSAEGDSLDSQYFVELSDDAVPALVVAFNDTSMPAKVHEKVGAALACIRYERELDDREYPWQSFHFARTNADQALKSIASELDVYKITDKDSWTPSVITPSKEEFSCRQYFSD